jgi:hypothetical protein
LNENKVAQMKNNMQNDKPKQKLLIVEDSTNFITPIERRVA